MRGHFEDMTGRRFGRLVILEELKYNKVKCQCDCGNVVILTKTNIMNGNTQSCGCLNRDRSAESLRSLTRDGGRIFISRLKSDKPQSNNSSGIKGVWFDKSRGLWAAEIKIRGKRYRLGRFAKLEDAAAARKQAEEKYFKPVIAEEGEEKMTENERLAHNAKVRKYQKKLGQISIRLPKEELARYKAAADAAGMTFRSWVLAALESRVVKI